MAKVTDQSIPSEDRILYKRQCQISTLSRGIAYVRSRFPWRLPKMQAGGRGVSPAQIVQRDRFVYVLDKYATLSASDKERWKDANPEYESYLFGYNFFMLEGLMGGGPVQAPQMVKTIQVLKASVPTTGGHTFNLDPTIDGSKAVVLIQGSARKVPKVLRGSGSIATGGSSLALGDTVDPDKCTVQLFGSSRKVPRVIRSSGSIAAGGSTHSIGGTVDPDKCTVTLNGNSYKEFIGGESTEIHPYVFALSSTQITIKWTLEVDAAATVGWEVTEHLEGSVAPKVTSLTTTHINIGWSEAPDAAAIVAWEVTEHPEGTVHPVLVSISNTQVAVDWAEEPDAAADVSITVVEYL